MKKLEVIKNINPVILNGIAHRGLHNKQFTENGLKAFENAINYGVAFEFDIHLTKDNQLVVCHDEDLIRTTGKAGIIEDLTLKEIKENYRLFDGGEIPTLQEVIDLNQEKVPMVIELKVFRKNYKPLSELAIKQLNENIKDKKNVMLISFDPRSLWPFKKQGYIRSLLVSHTKSYTWIFRNSVESIDMDHLLMNKKKVQRYAKKHFTNAWTIDNKELLENMAKYCDTLTFQFLEPDEVKNTLNNKK